MITRTLLAAFTLVAAFLASAHADEGTVALTLAV